jgi:hypothetical protein
LGSLEYALMKQPELLVNSPATAASKSKRRMASLPAPKTAPPKPHRADPTALLS